MISSKAYLCPLMKHLAGLQLHRQGSTLNGQLHGRRGQATSAWTVSRQVHLVPARPLAPVALVHELGTFQEVAGSRQDRGFGLREKLVSVTSRESKPILPKGLY